MTDYFITDTKWYNEYRNGADFDQNLGQFSDEINGTVDELVQVIMEFEITTEIFAIDFGTITYTDLTTQAKFTFNSNWFTEGISEGAIIDIFKAGLLIATETVLRSNGPGGGTMLTTQVSAGLIALASGSFSDLDFKISSVSDRLMFKYGLNPLAATETNYTSPFDSHEQAYSGVIGEALTPIERMGNFASWDLGTLEVRKAGTVNTYTHKYQLVHTFRTPFFTEIEISNIQSNPPLPPGDLISTNSLKYGFGIFLAETNNKYNKNFQNVGEAGVVKYYDLAVNDLPNNYSIQNLAFSNPVGTDTIETTETTNITFQIKKTSGNWVAGQKVILIHSKLPITSESENKLNSFDDVWLHETLTQLEGAASANGTIITDFDVDINGGDATLLDLSHAIAYSSAQQDLTSGTGDFILSIIVGDQTLGVYAIDKVNLKIESQDWSQVEDVSGLVVGNDTRFVTSGQAMVYNAVGPTNFSGWDGDLVGMNFKFQTKAQDGAKLIDFKFKVLAYNAVTGHFFDLFTIPVSLGKIPFTDAALTTYEYQIVKLDHQLNYNLPADDDFNRVKLTTVPPVSGTPLQDWEGSIGFPVTWRDWIENLGVPSVFIDTSKPNNNQNINVANYSGLEGYEIHAALDLTMASDLGPNTLYKILSTASTILQFNNDGPPGFGFDIRLRDVNGDITNNLYINQEVTIEAEATHSLGIPLGATAYAELIIEADGTTLQEWRLSSVNDWTNAQNKLVPSGANNLVETTDIIDSYTSECKTNPFKLILNSDYNIYLKLGRK